ncbi:unnamed protein product [Amoebophrya sp. A120]|nr:unnamed protein product [Amoebophrya sp. A120]|eukprot:GSA120T00001767001.1
MAAGNKGGHHHDQPSSAVVAAGGTSSSHQATTSSTTQQKHLWSKLACARRASVWMMEPPGGSSRNNMKTPGTILEQLDPEEEEKQLREKRGNSFESCCWKANGLTIGYTLYLSTWHQLMLQVIVPILHRYRDSEEFAELAVPAEEDHQGVCSTEVVPSWQWCEDGQVEVEYLYPPMAAGMNSSPTSVRKSKTSARNGLVWIGKTIVPTLEYFRNHLLRSSSAPDTSNSGRGSDSVVGYHGSTSGSPDAMTKIKSLGRVGEDEPADFVNNSPIMPVIKKQTTIARQNRLFPMSLSLLDSILEFRKYERGEVLQSQNGILMLLPGARADLYADEVVHLKTVDFPATVGLGQAFRAIFKVTAETASGGSYAQQDKFIPHAEQENSGATARQNSSQTPPPMQMSARLREYNALMERDLASDLKLVAADTCETLFVSHASLLLVAALHGQPAGPHEGVPASRGADHIVEKMASTKAAASPGKLSTHPFSEESPLTLLRMVDEISPSLRQKVYGDSPRMAMLAKGTKGAAGMHRSPGGNKVHSPYYGSPKLRADKGIKTVEPLRTSPAGFEARTRALLGSDRADTGDRLFEALPRRPACIEGRFLFSSPRNNLFILPENHE